MMMTLQKFLTYAAVISATTTGAAHATIVTFFDGIAAGRAKFNATVAAAGGVVKSDVWTEFTSPDRGDYTVARNDGAPLTLGYFGPTSGTGFSLSGFAINTSVEVGHSDPMTSFPYGITLTFDSPINAFGIEVEDWGTCCWTPSTDLFISFDDRDPMLVARSDHDLYPEPLFPSQYDIGWDVAEVVIAAFDDSGSFTKVSIWGTGEGEAIAYGGDVRYALLEKGSLKPQMAITPLPGAGWLLLGALGGAGLLRRRKPAN